MPPRKISHSSAEARERRAKLVSRIRKSLNTTRTHTSIKTASEIAFGGEKKEEHPTFLSFWNEVSELARNDSTELPHRDIKPAQGIELRAGGLTLRDLAELTDALDKVLKISFKRTDESPTALLGDPRNFPSEKPHEPTLDEILETAKAVGYTEGYLAFRNRKHVEGDRVPDSYSTAATLSEVRAKLIVLAGFDQAEAEDLELDKFDDGHVVELCERLEKLTGDGFEFSPYEVVP